MARGISVIALVSILLAACGTDEGAGQGTANPPPAEDVTTTASQNTAATDPTTTTSAPQPSRVSVADAMVAADGPLLVRGQIIRHTDGAVETFELCSALTRSIPPSCVGGAMELLGVEGVEFVAAPASAVAWSRPVDLLVEKAGNRLEFVGLA